MSLQAVYKGRYRGGTIHADRGDLKPLCTDHEYLNNALNVSKWLEVSTPVTCRHCLRIIKAQEKPERVTLQERILK